MINWNSCRQPYMNALCILYFNSLSCYFSTLIIEIIYICFLFIFNIYNNVLIYFTYIKFGFTFINLLFNYFKCIIIIYLLYLLFSKVLE